MAKLPLIQNAINRLLSLILSGSYLSNIDKIFYFYMSTSLREKNREVFLLKKKLSIECGIEEKMPIHLFLAESIKSFKSKINVDLPNLKCIQVVVKKKFDVKSYQNPKFLPVNQLCKYALDHLAPYIMDGFVHGSLSTMDFTEYSDLDTLFIIKQDVLEDPEKIKELEKRFIKSLRYLYEFDPLQHHSHFFLTECDLSFYNQSFLPISAIELSTSILGKGTHLRFLVRDSKDESKKRFFESVRIILRYANNAETLKKPYFLKGMLSHFMILPTLFLQLEGNYVSKKASFNIMKQKIPSSMWSTMEKVSALRKNWSQKPAFYIKKLNRVLGTYNPLLLSYLGKFVFRPSILRRNRMTPELLAEIDVFTRYLLHTSGINENRFEN